MCNIPLKQVIFVFRFTFLEFDYRKHMKIFEDVILKTCVHVSVYLAKKGQKQIVYKSYKI